MENTGPVYYEDYADRLARPQGRPGLVRLRRHAVMVPAEPGKYYRLR